MIPTPTLALRPRERRLALGAAVVIGCWGLVAWIIQPLWDRVMDARLHADTQLERLQALGRLLDESPEVEQRYADLSGYLQAGDPVQLQGAFFNELEALSRQSNVELSLKPRPVRHQDQASRFEVELDAEGPQGNLLAFIDALLRLPRLVSIERLRISGVPMKPELLRATVVLQHLAFTESAQSG